MEVTLYDLVETQHQTIIVRLMSICVCVFLCLYECITDDKTWPSIVLQAIHKTIWFWYQSLVLLIFYGRSIGSSVYHSLYA